MQLSGLLVKEIISTFFIKRMKFYFSQLIQNSSLTNKDSKFINYLNFKEGYCGVNITLDNINM